MEPILLLILVHLCGTLLKTSVTDKHPVQNKVGNDYKRENNNNNTSVDYQKIEIYFINLVKDYQRKYAGNSYQNFNRIDLVTFQRDQIVSQIQDKLHGDQTFLRQLILLNKCSKEQKRSIQKRILNQHFYNQLDKGGNVSELWAIQQAQESVAIGIVELMFSLLALPEIDLHAMVDLVFLHSYHTSLDLSYS